MWTHFLNQKSFSLLWPGSALQQVGPVPGLPTTHVGQGIEKVHNHQHPQRTLSIHTFAFWHCIGPSSVPKDNGHNSARSTTCDLPLDDILVMGADDAEHMRNLEEVLSRLKHHGLRLKRSKCEFLQSSVDYLGYHVDAQGLHTACKGRGHHPSSQTTECNSAPILFGPAELLW